jgi:segregation and condensation protein A
MTTDTAYQIELEVFTGPFDLLIKAIDDGAIGINQIALAKITATYLTYWQKEQPELVLAADFLIMAAYLLELKTKALLPAREELVADEELSNLEESLVSHLQEYQVFKNLAQTLKQRKEIFERVYGRHEGEAQEKEFQLVDISLKDLVVAFKKVYDEAVKREKIIPIEAEEVSLEVRIAEVKKLLTDRREGVPFIEIFVRKTRLEIVVTFLAILELAKQHFLRLTQDRRFGTILLFAKEVYEEIYGNNNSAELQS